MTTEQLLKSISASVVPAVMISACGLLCLAFYGRLSHIVARLRAFHRELLREQDRLAEAKAKGSLDAVTLERQRQMLDMLSGQSDRVSHRARLIRLTLLCLLGTIVCLTVSSLASGLGVFWPVLLYVAAPPFVAGMLLLLLGVILAMAEMYAALKPLEIERLFVRKLSDELTESLNHGDPK